MTQAEKAQETRRKHREAQEQKRATLEAERTLLRRSLVEVLSSEEATPGEKLRSAELLLQLDKRLS